MWKVAGSAMAISSLMCLVLLAACRNDHDSKKGAGGLVVEQVTGGTTLDRAGLQVGDLVFSWEAHSDGRFTGLQGTLSSEFDWWDLVREQASRGDVWLVGQREGKRRVFKVSPGAWVARLRPWLPPDHLGVYLQYKSRLAAGDFSAAAAELDALATGLGAEQTWQLRSWLLLEAAETWNKSRDWTKAEEVYRDALSASLEVRADAHILLALGDLYASRFIYTEAESEYLAAYNILKNRQSSSLLAGRALYKLGRLEEIRDNLGAAQKYFQRAAKLQETLAPESLDLASTLQHLGMVAWRRSDLDLAEGYHQRALDLKMMLEPGRIGVASSHQNLGWIDQARGEAELAEEHFRKALEIKERVFPDSVSLAYTLDSLGEIAAAKGEPVAALELFMRSLKIREKHAPESREVAYSLSKLGFLAIQLEDWQAAEEYFDRMLGIWEKLAPVSFAQAEGLRGMGLVAWQRGQRSVAARHFEGAINTLEAVVQKLGGSRDLQASSRAQRHLDYYRAFITLLLDMGSNEDALRVLERSRGQSLLAMLAERDLVFPHDLAPELLRRRQDLTDSYNRIQRELGTNSHLTQTERQDRLWQLSRLLQERGDLGEEIRQASPEISVLQYPQPVDLKAARQILDPGTIVLSYSVDEKTANLFVLSRDGELQIERLSIGEKELRSRVKHFLELCSRVKHPSSSEQPLIEAGKALYRILVRPAEERIRNYERVLVIPDGPLHLLPFAALVRPMALLDESQYFVEWKALHQVLSLTLYVELRKLRRSTVSRRSDVQEVVLFGDPHYPPRSVSRVDIDTEARSATGQGLFEWHTLPHTRYEVEQIAALYPSDTVRVYLGSEATEERVKSINSAQFVHFAGHGYFDAHIPLNSAVVLTIPQRFSNHREDGLLQAWEILESVRINTDLVVLSACRTGFGEELSGEGLIGLTRAFQHAGARAVLASLWNVEDQMTSELMIRFYCHLNSGKLKDEALRAAQIDLIRGRVQVKGRVASAPYYWAAFQLYGDYQ